MGTQLIRFVRQGRSFSGHERNCVFLNTHHTRFANISAISGLDFPDDARAAGRCDWDFDGDVDFWISNRNAPQVRFLRNDLDTHNHFISLRLQGTKCNGDAIGARVEVHVADGRAPLLRTVRAGDGYLTQSSKWLHIGLGPHNRITSIRVRWPGGGWEDFKHLEIDRQYVLAQNSGIATRWLPPRPGIDLPAMPVRLPSGQEAAAISLSARIPVPRLTYQTVAGESAPVFTDGGQPVLLMLWASWCSPCLSELASVMEHQAQIREQGLRVLALSVDLVDESLAGEDDVRRLMSSLAFSSEWGFATSELLSKLQLTHDYLFGLHQPLRIPMSFLIDGDGRMRAIYRGELDIERIAVDVKRLDADSMQRRDFSVPFAGRWAGSPLTLRIEPLVLDLIQAGYLEDASEYVQRAQNQIPRGSLLSLIGRLGMAYYERGLADRADTHFRMARKIDPKTVVPELSMAKHWCARRDFQQASVAYEAAISRNPKSARALNDFAWFLATCPDDKLRDGTRAAELIQSVLRSTDVRDPNFLDTWAAALAEQRDFEQAASVAAQAMEMARETRMFRLAGEIAARKELFDRKVPYRLPANGEQRD